MLPPYVTYKYSQKINAWEAMEFRPENSNHFQSMLSFYNSRISGVSEVSLGIPSFCSMNAMIIDLF